MITTYNRTMFIEDLTKAEVTIYASEGCKYTAKTMDDIGRESVAHYHGVTSWDIIEGGQEADEIEEQFNDADEFHEYLVLHFVDGSYSTFRNSHVDMHIR